MRQKRIEYAIDPNSGQVISKVGDNYVWAVLDFAGMKPENGFQANYSLEILNGKGDWNLKREWYYATHTRKIPLEIKNIHRKLHGMKPLE